MKRLSASDAGEEKVSGTNGDHPPAQRLICGMAVFRFAQTGHPFCGVSAGQEDLRECDPQTRLLVSDGSSP